MPEMDLETLWVRIKSDASGIAPNKIEPLIRDMVNTIKRETLAARAALVFTPRLNKSELREGLEDIRNLVLNSIGDINSLAFIDIKVGMAGGGGNLAAAVSNLNAMQLIAQQPSFLKFALDMQKLSDATKTIISNGNVLALANEMSAAQALMAAVGPVPNAIMFASDMDLIVKTMTTATATSVGAQALATSLTSAHVLLTTLGPLPNAKTFAKDIEQVAQILNKIGALPNLAANLGSFVTLISQANTALTATQGMPLLKTLGDNATAAAKGFSSLNRQLNRYINLMTKLAALPPPPQFASPPPVPPGMPPVWGAGGSGQGAGSGSSMGFNPIRRSLGMLTSMATSLAVGFFGFEMFRQVTGFDEQMSRAMAATQVGRGRMDTAGVRGSMTDEILNLSRRVATGPRELAEAFRELAAAGYGTANAIQALAVVEQFAFISTMEAASATQHLTTIQRQLGMVSNDAVQNASNLRHIGDVITSGALVSGMSGENFIRGIQRITPHLQFLNRGLEDSVSLMAAFGRIDSTNATARTEALIRGIGVEFVRSITSPAQLRSGGQAGLDPIGHAAHRFHAGQGVQPIHRPADNVRLASQAWGTLGVTRDMATDVGAVIRQVDAATRNLDPLMRLQRIQALSLSQSAQEALLSLLSSGEAMQAFAEAARNADGTMRDLSNERLQSFSSQFAILKNNLTIVAIQIGSFLVPALQEVNNALLTGLDYWNDLGRAGRETILIVVGIVVAMAALRFAIPYLFGMMKILFWDTMVAGARSAWFAISTLGYGIYYLFRGIVVVVEAVIFSFGLMLTVAKISLGFATTAMTVFGIATAITSFFMLVFKAGLTMASAIMAAFGITTQATVLSTIAYSIATVIAKIVTWAFTSALTVLSGVLLIVHILLGTIVLVLLALIVLGGILVIVLAAITSAVLLLVHALIWFVGITANVNWRAGWNTFVEGVDTAFWATVGFFEHFQQNIQTLMAWMDQNWPIMIFNVVGTIEQAFVNMWHNITIGFAAALMTMISLTNDFISGWLGVFRDPLVQNVLRILNPQAGAALNQIGQVGIPVPRAMRDLGIQQFRGLGDNFHARALEELRLNLDISPETRAMIENMFNFRRDQVAELSDASNRIGVNFKEISLRRFVLENSPSEEDTRRQELIIAEQTRDLLRRLVEMGEAAQLLAAANVPLMFEN